jgi:putative sterol carrier protein
MATRTRPPHDISPHDFFTRWLPERVANDHERRTRLGETEAVLVFELTGEPGGVFTLHVAQGVVRGEVGRSVDASLVVRVDVETWRQLNRGDLSAPEAALRRRLHLDGDLVLALKLHLILG